MFCSRRGIIRLTEMAALAGATGLMVSACAYVTAASPVAATLGAVIIPDPLASLSGNQVMLKALANLKSAPTVRMSGSFTDSGTNYSLDLGLKPGYGCAGTIAMGSRGSFKLVVIGTTVYFNPDSAFWKANAGANAGTVIGVIRGRYIKGSASDKDLASFSSLCDVSKRMGSVTGAGTGTVSKRKLTVLHGDRVLPLHDSAGDVVDVTDTSRPELLSVSEPKDSTEGAANLALSEGVAVTLAAPPASQVIDGSQVGL